MVERDGKQDCFHRIVIALIGCRLGVATDMQKKFVEILLVFPPQSTPELCPSLSSFFNMLAERRNGAPHVSSLREAGCEEHFSRR